MRSVIKQKQNNFDKNDIKMKCMQVSHTLAYCPNVQVMFLKVLYDWPKETGKDV